MRVVAERVRKASFWPCPGDDLRRLQSDVDRSQIRIVSGQIVVTVRGLGEALWFSRDGKLLRRN